MLLTKRNEYALQAMVLLASGRVRSPATARSLAGLLKTSPAFMSKIVQKLSRAGLLKSRRGRGGGLALARPPQLIIVGEIFRAVDGELLVSPCVRTGHCAHLPCPLHPALRRIQFQLDLVLNRARLSQIAKGVKL